MSSDKKCPSPESEKPPKDPKPQLRGLHTRQCLRNVYIACGLSILSGVLFHFFHNEPRKQAYKDFYANYDPMESFECMQKAGLLSSCPPEPEVKPKKTSGIFGRKN